MQKPSCILLARWIENLLRGIAILLLFGLCFSGCSGKQESAGSDGNKVVIKGSNTVGEELAPRLISEYRKNHPGVVIDLESKATGYGLASLMAGGCDIAAASRLMIKDEQQQAELRKIEFNEYTIGSYSVAVVLNANNPVNNLSRDQIRDIFSGAIENWKDVGGPDAPIHRYIRDPISGTYLGFRELALQDKAYSTKNATELTSYDAIAQAVAKDANAVGYTSVQLAATGGLKGVSVGGVAPTIASVNEGKYPYSRILRLFTNKAREAPAARDFIQFVQSQSGQQIVAQLGYVPKP